jgi:hypothetical protein
MDAVFADGQKTHLFLQFRRNERYTGIGCRDIKRVFLVYKAKYFHHAV